MQLKYDKSCFYLPSAGAGGLPRAIMIITVDDIFGCGEPGVELNLKRLEKEFEFPITIKFLEENGMDDSKHGGKVFSATPVPTQEV